VKRACAVLVVLGLVASGCQRHTPEQRDYVESLMELRTRKDRSMQSSDGPLLPEQRARFKGLSYYPPNFDLVFEVALDRLAAPDTLQFPTSQSGFDSFLRLGTLRFQVRGREQRLTLFSALDGSSLFLPFRDATSGGSTYGAGRYLEPEPLTDGRFRLDFNQAYNPYCAYNAQWVCPLPPAENELEFEVTAGERNFPLAAH